MKTQSTYEGGDFNVNELTKDEFVSIIKRVTPKIEEASLNYLNRFLEFKTSNIMEVEFKEISKESIDFITQELQW